MLGALSLAFVDSINLLLIGVIVAVGIVVPAGRGRYGKITSLLIAGDWLGVAGLAFVMLAVFDGLGPVVKEFVDGPVFGIILIATGVVTAVLALRGGDQSELIERLLGPLRSPGPMTVLTGVVLGLIQSATSAPFYGGLALLSSAGIDPVVRYSTVILYATVALSLPTLSALVVGWVRASPDSVAARGFSWARANPRTVNLAATWAVAALLILLGVIHMM